ncbi:MAG: protein TolA, partial [Luteimonas sp.]
MRETRADTTHAILYAIGLHVLLFALAFLGLLWTRSSAPAAAGGPVIEADLVDPNALSAKMRRAMDDRPEAVATQPVEEPQPPEVEAAPEVQPLPEPLPEDALVQQQVQAQEPVPDPDPQEQELVESDSMSVVTAAREQEEKRRQEQIDLTERERQEEAEKQRRLAAEQLEDVRVLRAIARRDTRLAEEKLKQLADRRARSASEQASVADASASAPRGDAGERADLQGRYAAALSEAIRRNWTRPENVPLGQRCRMTIR